MSACGGTSLPPQAHGDSCLALLLNRLQGDGLYLFDEPEAALSPLRQLAVLTLMHRLVYHRSQLVIATHSPILLGYPNATILELDETGVHPIAFDDAPQVELTRSFLADPQRVLHHLLRTEP